MNRYFFGHHKCATNWMRRYVGDLCRHFNWRFEARNGGIDPSFNENSQKGAFIFYWNSRPVDIETMSYGSRGFHCIRDPRDALVSGYWSWKISHSQNNERIRAVRTQLQRLSLEEGLLLMVDHTTCLEQLEGWDPAGRDNVLTIRYEDMVADTYKTIKEVLGFLHIHLNEEALEKLISQNSFKAICGRNPGEEDTGNHFRKGVAGDWRNCFTDAVKQRFKQRHQHALCRLGYESNEDW